MYKIALIVPYFGKLPPFFKVWEAAALENDTVDFFVLTDDRTVACWRNCFLPAQISYKDHI